jgi:hypothetical protein
VHLNFAFLLKLDVCIATFRKDCPDVAPDVVSSIGGPFSHHAKSGLCDTAHEQRGLQ